jgi:hypothetical protein
VSRITFSKLDRLERCAASHALPQVYSEGVHAARGSAIHAYLCALSLGTSREVALAAVPEEHRTLCAALDAPQAGTPELAVAWSFETGEARALGVNVGRDYETRDGEIAGTLDLLVDGEPPEVIDYKAGFLDVAPPASNLQLGAQALSVARLRGAAEVKATVRKIKDDGTTEDRSHVLDVFALVEVEARIKEIVRYTRRAERLVRAGQTPDVAEGEHCRWCPARAACPAKVGALVQLRKPDGLAQRFEALLGEAPAEALALYERAEEAMKTIRGQLYAFAREQPITLPDGQVFGLRSTTRNSVDAQTALRVLTALVGSEAAAPAFELETSRAAILRAVPKAQHKAALAALEEAGAFIPKTTETVTKFQPRSTP